MKTLQIEEVINKAGQILSSKTSLLLLSRRISSAMYFGETDKQRALYHIFHNLSKFVCVVS